jgi:ABC-2 type transport system permease protein
VRVTIYFDGTEPLYPMCVSLLKEYANANSRIAVEAVDYVRNPGAAQIVKTKYKLTERSDRDLIIFDCKGQLPKIVHASELSEYDMKPFLAMQTQEIKRTHFKGELLFTSAILKVTTPRALKAYFLDGHGEHSPDATDKVSGYSQFADVLAENTLKWEKLRLEGPGDVPADCTLLIVAGPRQGMVPEVIAKIDRYLKQGGRMLALFNNPGLQRASGLERVLAEWGVTVGQDVVYDDQNSVTKEDVVVSLFGSHPLSKPFGGTSLYLVRPRSITKARSSGADPPQVDVLATTGPGGRIVTDVRPDGRIYRLPSDHIGEIPLMVAVEKGGLRNVSGVRGATRIVVVGDSYFLGNETIGNVGNRDFATHALNWLMAKDDLLVAIPPKPIKEYKVNLTRSQLSAAHWILLAALPGAVLVFGWLVWLRRRR